MSNQVHVRHDVDIAIIGAGVCGLAAAYVLRELGKSVRVLEAADEVGGRIRSFCSTKRDGVILGDRGPTWVWPEYQPTIERWLSELDIELFPQFEVGNSIVEKDVDTPPKATFLPAQHGSMRIAGGTAQLIERLMVQLGDGIVETSAMVSRVARDDAGIILHYGESSVRASQVIVAVPPRVAVSTIDWAPALPENLERALKILPTWMAAHAKAVIVYKEPFWRKRGLSGRIASRVGPLMEVHDHCSTDGETAALFGFVGWPHSARAMHRDQLPALIEQQLIRCLGDDAANPKGIFIEDWSENNLIAQPDDLLGPQAHPAVGADVVRQLTWNNRLVFAAAETASHSPGLIEGAFIAAENAARLIASSSVS